MPDAAHTSQEARPHCSSSSGLFAVILQQASTAFFETAIDEQDGDQAAAKRQKVDSLSEEETRAHARARAFLKDFAAIPLASLAPEEGVQQAKQLYAQLQQDASSMPALHRLLAVSAG